MAGNIINPIDERVFTDNFAGNSAASGTFGELGWGVNNMGVFTPDTPVAANLYPYAGFQASGTQNVLGYAAPFNNSRAPFKFYQFDYFIWRLAQGDQTASDASIRLCVTQNLGVDPSSSVIGVWIERLTTDTNWFIYGKNAFGTAITRIDTGIAYGGPLTVHTWKLQRSYVTGYFTLFYSSDGGYTWTQVAQITAAANLPAATTGFNVGIHLIKVTTVTTRIATPFFQLSVKRLTQSS